MSGLSKTPWKYACLVEYEGTRYYGFQIQPKVPTVQGELERALQMLTGERVHIIGASRTDAGVHAKGQVIAFGTFSTLSPQVFVDALNFYLPEDIAIKDCAKAEDDFNPRRQATRREYRYTILNSPTPSPLNRGYSYLVSKPLNIEAMNQACEVLLGKHDFSSFTAAKVGNAVRTVFKAEVRREDELVFFDMAANSFLPQQVRRTAGPLIRAGLGKMTVEEFWELAQCQKIGLAEPLAPPYGLCLMKVSYPDFEFHNG